MAAERLAAKPRLLPDASIATLVCAIVIAFGAAYLPSTAVAAQGVETPARPTPKRSGDGPAETAIRSTLPPPTHYWHDGLRQRPLTIEPGLQADFSGGRAAIMASGDSAIDGADTLKAARRSPVFRDPTGQLRALPGGVMLMLRSPLDEASVRRLLEAEPGAVRPALRRIGDATWLLESPPGIASLELANRLHKGGRFSAVTPNWWTPVARR